MYPLLVLFESPIPFLAYIGLSQFIYLYNSFYVPSWKVLAILKALYPIGFHMCFVIFLVFEDAEILSYTSIICLCVFLVGSIHYLIESAVKMIRIIIKVVKRLYKKFKNNKISDRKNGKKQTKE